MNKYIKTKFLVVPVVLAMMWSVLSIRGDSIENRNEILEMYLDGRFSNIAEKYQLSDKDKTIRESFLLYIESIIRNGEIKKADALIGEIRQKRGSIPEIKTLEGMSSLAKGDLIHSSDIADSLLEDNVTSFTLLQLKFFLELYKRNYTDAEQWLNRLKKAGNGFGDSPLYFLIASDFYRSSGDYEKLSKLYKEKLKSISRRKNRALHSNLKLNYKLYGKKSGIPFHIDSESEFVEIPFESSGRGSLKSIILTRGNKKYNILLDTGNTSGWLVHSRELREDLKSFRGGRMVMQVGTESGKLDGFNIFCPSVTFKEFTLSGLFGNYIPKPRQDFFDANLNPAMIRGRIVSLDFIDNRMILRTKKKFNSDIEKNNNLEVMKIPWFGYDYPMVPVICNARNGLAIIETGAENISVRDDFASEMGIQLTPKSKYLSNGKVFKYSLGSVSVQLGMYIFVRREAEVWPLVRFRNSLTGFEPHVIIGPEAFEGKFIVSFLREENVMVFQYEKRN